VPSVATWSLTLISLAAGWLLAWGFLRISNRPALAASISRVRAHLMELRLFADEPALVWTAQWDLVKANAVFLWCMLRPLALLAIPAALLMWQLEPFYARTPLQPNAPALLTWESSQAATAAPTLASAGGIAVETPAVRWNGNRNASWRLRAIGSGAAQLPLGQGMVQVVAGDSFTRLPLSQSLHGESVTIAYPERQFSLFGWSMGWASWFLLWSSLSAMAAVWWLR
jgi:hypothetical protein